MLKLSLLCCVRISVIIQIANDGPDQIPPEASIDETFEPHLKKWTFLAAKQSAAAGAARTDAVDTSSTELSKYLIDILNSSPATYSITFWKDRSTVFPRLAQLAEDLLSAPASQAFVNRIFTLCGMLTAGGRNRME